LIAIIRRLALATAVLSVSGCGYTLAGRGSARSLPAHVRVISIPLFQNQSTTPEVDQVITTAVQEEFQGRGRFTTTPDQTGGDAILRGVISNVRTELIATDPTTNQATRLAVIVTANFEFVDLKDPKEPNRVIWSRNGWQAREEYDISPGAVVNDPAALFRQDASALNRLARSLARSLVASILDAF
jgi:hypothetical protein